MTLMPALTQHAVDRARTRWLEPDDEAARRAILAVLKHGEPCSEKGCTVYKLGTRHVRVVDDTAVTVTVYHARRARKLARLSRRDGHERAHVRWRQ